MGLKLRVREGVYMPQVEEGLYTAKFVGYDQRTITVRTKNGEEEREIIVWRFKVTELEDEPILEGVSSTRFSPRAKAYKWVSAMLGRSPAVGEEIDLDDLIGSEVLIRVVNKPLRSGGFVSRVDDVLPAKKKKRTKKKKVEEEYDYSEELEEEEGEEYDYSQDIEEEEEEEEEEPPKPKKKKKLKVK